MNLVKKASVALAALSMVTAPVAASASAPRFDDLRVATEMQDESALVGGGGSWLLLLLAAAAIIGGIVIAVDGSDDSPTSP